MGDKFEFTSKSGNTYIYNSKTNVVHSKNENIIVNDSDKNTNQDVFYDFTTEDIKNYIASYGYSELIIEMTTFCNLRCRYCIYSEEYTNNRSHSNEFIEFDTAKKAIDFYMNQIIQYKSYNPERIPVISFYGGEPLANFNVIKQCVEYTSETYPIKIIYSITTNATMLTDEMINFFADNKFLAVFSIDGNESQHNRNRVFAGGGGSFEKAYSNVKKYISKSKRAAFVNSVYDFNTDLYELLNFWSEQDTNLILLSISPVNPNSTDYYKSFDEEKVKRFNDQKKELEKLYEELMLKETLTDKEKKERNFLSVFIGKAAASVFMKEFYKEQSKRILPYGGACVPGDKLFVDIKGHIYPCEKLERSMKIGNVDDGIDYEQIAEYLKLLRDKILASCKECKIRNICSLCYMSFLKEGEFIKCNDDCIRASNNYLRLLSSAYSFSEKKPDWFDDFTTKYYTEIREMAVILK